MSLKRSSLHDQPLHGVPSGHGITAFSLVLLPISGGDKEKTVSAETPLEWTFHQFLVKDKS